VRHTRVRSAAAALLGVVLVGCGSPADDTDRARQPLSTVTETSGAPTPTTPPGSTTGSATGSGGAAEDGPAPDDGRAPFVPLEKPGEAPGSGSASVVGARTGEHQGYERVVLDVEGGPGEQAGWYVTAVPEPLQDASGELVDVDGDRFLDVSVTGVANGADGRVDSAGRAAFTGTVEGSGDLVEQVYVGGAWEGQAQVLVGLDGGVTEYRVLRLSDPQRIVVDVR
jgi:hypothetical protein